MVRLISAVTGAQVKTNAGLILVLIAVLSIVTLYSLAGKSDRVDMLTAGQQAAVVARWR